MERALPRGGMHAPTRYLIASMERQPKDGDEQTETTNRFYGDQANFTFRPNCWPLAGSLAATLPKQ